MRMSFVDFLKFLLHFYGFLRISHLRTRVKTKQTIVAADIAFGIIYKRENSKEKCLNKKWKYGKVCFITYQ